MKCTIGPPAACVSDATDQIRHAYLTAHWHLAGTLLQVCLIVRLVQGSERMKAPERGYGANV